MTIYELFCIWPDGAYLSIPFSDAKLANQVGESMSEKVYFDVEEKQVFSSIAEFEKNKSKLFSRKSI